MGSLFKPTKAAFARAVQKECRAAGFVGEYDPEEFEIQFGDGQVVYLGNLYSEYCQARTKRRLVLAKIVAVLKTATEGAPAFGEARIRLRPRLMHRLHIEQGRWKGYDFPHKLLTPRLAVTVVVDLPECIMHVGSNTLEQWGVSFEECLGPARDNLWHISNEPFKERSPGIWEAPWKDHYAASRLILEPLILRLELAGNPVAWAPDRDTLWVTGSDNAKGLEAIYHEIRFGRELSYPVCLAPLELRGECWHHIGPADVERLVTSSDYCEQRQALDRHHEETGADIYVANCGTIEDSATRQIAFTWTHWTDGVQSLLPETDRVYMGDMENPVLEDLTWSEVRERYSDKMEATDLWPPRWRVGSWH